MGCGESFSKLLLIIFNVLFFIIGAGILGIGIWAKVDKSNLFEMMRRINLDDTSFSNTGSQLLNTIAISLIVLGAFTFITGFCGCCGAIKESQCLLYTYAFLVGIVVVAEVGVGIYAGVEQKKFVTKITSTLKALLNTEFNGIYNRTSTGFTRVFTALMIELKCCGATGETDFANITIWGDTRNNIKQKHPVGCCKMVKTSFGFNPENPDPSLIDQNMVDKNCPFESKPQLNQEGCVDSLINLIKKNLGIVIGVCVGLGLFEILCIVFACCVARGNN